jgi:hypothetical protein
MGALAGRLGQTLVEHVSPATGKIMNLVLGALAGAVLLVLIGLGIAWLYKLTAVRYVVVWPAIIGGLIGAYMAARRPYNASLNIGLAIYTVTRTILNALRSVEALIMVIVFAVWVGIGPFAGVLALGCTQWRRWPSSTPSRSRALPKDRWRPWSQPGPTACR